jgi:hypothetical protein
VGCVMNNSTMVHLKSGRVVTLGYILNLLSDQFGEKNFSSMDATVALRSAGCDVARCSIEGRSYYPPFKLYNQIQRGGGMARVPKRRRRGKISRYSFRLTHERTESVGKIVTADLPSHLVNLVSAYTTFYGMDSDTAMRTVLERGIREDSDFAAKMRGLSQVKYYKMGGEYLEEDGRSIWCR